MNYESFIFKDYAFNLETKKLTLSYSFDNILDFSEEYFFDFDFVDFDNRLLDQTIQSLFFMAGVSYFKAFPSATIEIKKGQLDKRAADFFGKTYQLGLGEFFYTNGLNPDTKIIFPSNTDELEAITNLGVNSGLLIGIGGGKDSLVSVELLRNTSQNVATWSVGHRPQLTPLVDRIGLPHYWVERTWDRKLLDINKNGALNGHIPISAIIATVGTVIAVLSGRKDVVVSNESSANEPTLHYQGFAINHQYSKSMEFEKDYQTYLKNTVGDNVEYYSCLRPFSEVAIAERFALNGFDKYYDVFSSCNRAFTNDSNHIFWDGTCPKCAFVFLALTPFIDRLKLENLFGSKNLLLDPDLKHTYRELLGIEGDKPLECVGEIKESRAAMRLSISTYPELSEYSFDIPENYSYKNLSSHSMPDDIYRLIAAN
jgi:UDP-N-acetyl-alpha-D-muramoyl-L-alanyl-L-glutamate epimerase